jgi:photosystem II stability/assembly factor-like uncharacterized protein
LSGSDTLSIPAKMGERSSSSVLLAVTRAGARLIAVGERGIILVSDDNAKSWKQVKSPVSVALTNVYFVSANKGWVVGHGGVVLHSNDAGSTWVKQFDGERAAQAILAAAKSSSDSGRRLALAERMVTEGADKPFLDVYFADDDHGLIVGAYGLIFTTDDGGQLWHPALDSIDNPKGKHLYDIEVAGTDWYIAGEQGALFRSMDRGRSWNTIKTPYNGSYFGVLAAPQGRLLVYGLRGNAFSSTDHGQTWQKVDIGMPITVTTGLRKLNGQVILADEAGHVWQSGDEDAAFRPVTVPNPAPFTGAVIAADGTLVLSGARGITLVAAKYLSTGANK